MILNFWNANNVNISLKKSYFDLIIVSAGKNRYQQFSQTKFSNSDIVGVNNTPRCSGWCRFRS